MRIQFENYIDNALKNINGDYIDIVSGNVHRAVGGYPGSNHRMPVCCEVMYSRMKGNDVVLYAPPKGKGATLKIRYYRRSSNRIDLQKPLYRHAENISTEQKQRTDSIFEKGVPIMNGNILSNIRVGEVLQNPQKGISTIHSIDNNTIKYTRGNSIIPLPTDVFFQVLDDYNGKKCSSSDLRKYLPSVFDSNNKYGRKGHSCNCTFLFMLAVRLNLTESGIQGSGRAWSPYYVVFSWREKEQKGEVIVRNTKDELIKMFDADMQKYHKIRKESGYEARIIENSISSKGGYETALRFCDGTAKGGFINLHKRGLLKYSLEALVVKPEYSAIFPSEQVEKCKTLLREYGYTDMNDDI